MAKAKVAAIVEDGAVYVLQAGTPIYVKTADICTLTGDSNQWVGQLVSKGIINKSATPHGSLFNLIETGKALYANVKNRKGSENDPEFEKLELDRAKADTSLKISKAAIANMEMKELQGKMHRSEDVEAMTEDLIFTIRNALLSLPGRLAVDVANCSDAAECSAKIQSEVYKIMAELSNYKYNSKNYEERVRDRQGKELISENETESDT